LKKLNSYIHLYFLIVFRFIIATFLLSIYSPIQATVNAQDRLKWKFEMDFYSSPVVDEDGTIYIAGEDQYFGTQALLAIAPDGIELWHHYFRDSELFAPAIGDDGTLYFGSERNFYAFDPDSVSIKWTFPAEVYSSPAIGSDGTIYIGCNDTGFLYALNPEGTLEWKCLIGKGAEDPYKNIKSSPAIGADGTIYVACRDSHLYAVTPWGTIKWKCEVDHFFETGSPAIGADGTIYAGPHGHRMYAINPDGTVQWYYSQISNPGDSSPVVAADGTIYIGNVDGSNGSLYAFNADGTVKWSYFFGTYVHSSPVIGTDGTVYLSGPDGFLYAFNPDGTIKWKYEIGVISRNAPAMSSDGTLYVGTEEGLYAFNTDSNGYQDGAPWPCFMHNNTRCVARDDIVLPDLYTVSGQVVMPDSLALEGIAVSVSGLTTETLEDGSFTLHLPDGKYTLEIHADTISIPKIIYFAVDSANITIQIADQKHAVSGRITEKGEPLVGITVSIDDASVITDENGMYSFVLNDGTYILMVDVGENSFPNSREFTIDGADMVLDDFSVNRFLWEYETGDDVWDFPVFDTDGSILLGTMDDIIYHLNSDGTNRATYTDIDTWADAPSQGKDGTFYLTSWGGLIAWSPSGGIFWSLDIEENGFGAPPAIGHDGTLYIGSRKYVYAVNPHNGSILWTFAVGSFIASSPSIAQDGTIYVSSNDKHIYALNPDGILKWEYESTASFQATPVIGRDGVIYIGGYDNFFHALNPDGTLRWKFETMSATHEDAVIDADGTIYFLNQDQYLYALNPDGTLKWKFFGSNYWCSASLVITGHNTILMASKDGYLYSLGTDGSLLWKHQFDDCRSITPVLADNGMMYLLMKTAETRTGFLRVFTEVLGYQKNAPWPCKMGNNQRTCSISDQITGIENEKIKLTTDNTPESFTLGQNYPNPFNTSTTIEYGLPQDGHVTMSIYNIYGQVVGVLKNEYQPAGNHSIIWDAIEEPSGLYFCTLKANGFTHTRKMVLVK